MTLCPSYECDSEFFKLMMRRCDVDLTTLALELARDAYPNLDFQQTVSWINERSGELASPVSRAKTEQDALRELSLCLSGEFGIHGDEECFCRPESSYLNRVIETRRGIPISLSLLYMEIGRRLGLELRGVSAPMHFLLRFEAVGGPVFLDAFSHGRLMTQAECCQWFGEKTQLPLDRIQATLKPVGPRCLVMRMLNNLKSLYVRLEQWTAVWLVQHRLTALDPASFEQRRDLALVSLKANRPGQAVDLLECCMQTAPCHERELISRQLAEARRQLLLWN